MKYKCGNEPKIGDIIEFTNDKGETYKAEVIKIIYTSSSLLGNWKVIGKIEGSKDEKEQIGYHLWTLVSRNETSKGGACIKCKEFNEYQNGPFICYVCKNRS